MATMFEKTYTLPTITNSRLTCVGMQYTVVTPEFIDIVTTNGEKHTCTCGSSTCEHIHAVKRLQVRNTIASEKREAYCTVFGIYA